MKPDSASHRAILGFPCRGRQIGRGLAVGLVFCVLAEARSQTTSDYQVKAAYLYNFAKYAQWPEHSLPSGSAPFVIGVFSGDDEFVDVLKETIRGKTAGTHPIEVRRVHSYEEMLSCHAIFIRSSAGHKRTEAAISSLAATSILLVGEDDDFLREGGMFNLVAKNGTVRFEVNQESLQRANMRLGPELVTATRAGQDSSNQVKLTSSGDARHLRVGTPPAYPEVARQLNVKGVVQVELTVARDGTVKDVRVIGGHPMLTDALVKAVRGWQYEAATKESRVMVKVVFGP